MDISLSRLGDLLAPLFSADNRMPFGTQSLAELGERQPTGLDKAVSGSLSQLGSLPQRAMASSEAMRGGYGYDPAPAVEAALLTMGGTGFGAPVGVAGAGPTRLNSRVMEQYRSGGRARSASAIDDELEAIEAERQAAFAGVKAKRLAQIQQEIADGKIPPGSTMTADELKFEARRAQSRQPIMQSDVPAAPDATRLNSEVMQVYRSRGQSSE